MRGQPLGADRLLPWRAGAQRCPRLNFPLPPPAVAGVVIAAEMGRSVVLPDFLQEGMQNTTTAVTAKDSPNVVPFG